jgi:hypothetical protein
VEPPDSVLDPDDEWADDDEKTPVPDWSGFKGTRLPVVHFCGTSRSLHANWDPNANSRMRGKPLPSILHLAERCSRHDPDLCARQALSDKLPRGRFGGRLFRSSTARNAGDLRAFRSAESGLNAAFWGIGSTSKSASLAIFSDDLRVLLCFACLRATLLVRSRRVCQSCTDLPLKGLRRARPGWPDGLLEGD